MNQYAQMIRLLKTPEVMAAGVLDAPLNHQEVMEMGNKVKGTFRALLDGVIRKM